jgi:uncharacterized membrane protein
MKLGDKVKFILGILLSGFIFVISGINLWVYTDLGTEPNAWVDVYFSSLLVSLAVFLLLLYQFIRNKLKNVQTK